MDPKKTLSDKTENKATLRFSSNILRRLGEELTPDPSKGLVELIKNSYDADAKKCTIELMNINAPGGSIIITDNGDGMGADEIQNSWLVLGSSTKEAEKKTRLGRRQVGNKGLGRLAALRMGTNTTLTSVPIDNLNMEYFLEINWDRFENADTVDEVDLEIIDKKFQKENEPGTTIMLDMLKAGLNRNDVKKLARAIILLADPFGDTPGGFRPVLKAPEFEDLETLVDRKYFNDAEFHLVAKIDDQGFSKASAFDWRGNELYTAGHSDLRPRSKDKPYRCPETKFNFWVFLLSADKFTSRSATIGEIREWLKTFGGIHLYYNGLRVAPYGDEGNDWVGLNLLRAKSPEVRPSTNTSMGRVEVSDSVDVLKQKTDRDGFVENEAFEQLREFTVDSLEWLARRRLGEAEKIRVKIRAEAPKKSDQAKEQVKSNISVIEDKSKKETLDNSFEKYTKTRDKEVNKLRKEVQLYRTLGTVGITSAVFAHESANNPLKLIALSIRTVSTRAKKYIADKYTDVFEKPINRIIGSLDSLKVLANVTLSLLDYEKRRSGRIDVHEVINSVIKLYEPFVKDRVITIIKDFDSGNPYLRGSIAAVESIISNLLNNSLVAFEQISPGERKIAIRTTVIDTDIEIRIMDNGPGIVGISKSDIWLPGQTTTKSGTGLGLTIVRDAVTDLGGKVDALEKGELDGAEIIIELPILGA